MTHKTNDRHQTLASPTVLISKDATLSEKLRFSPERHGGDVNLVLNFSTSTSHTKGTGQAPFPTVTTRKDAVPFEKLRPPAPLEPVSGPCRAAFVRWQESLRQSRSHVKKSPDFADFSGG